MTTTNEVRAIGQTAALPVTSARSLVPTTIPEPVPGPHDLLVEVRAVSVNPVDVKLRGGSEPDGGVRVLGFDASGTVRAVGDAVTLFAPGGSLRRLRLERIDLYQLHRIDQRVPLGEQLGALASLRDEGLIRHVGLSEVSVAELRAAQRIVPIATVQNLYNLVERSSEDLVRVTAELGVGFIPWFPLATGGLTRSGGPLGAMAARAGVSPSQIALAWLLQHASNVLPIPGTSSPAHLEENVAAAAVRLSPAEVAALDRAA